MGLVVTGDLTPRWVCWFASMSFFLYIVYELLVGLVAATQSETDPEIAGKIKTAQVMTVISWCTYPVVYLFPMLGISAATAVVSIQMGYCVSDIISKCGVGLVIYQISYAKSQKAALLPKGGAARRVPTNESSLVYNHGARPKTQSSNTAINTCSWC